MPKSSIKEIKIIEIDSTPNLLLLKINKRSLYKMLRILVVLLLISGFVVGLVISYNIDGFLFWLLVKLGTVLGFLGYLTSLKKRNIS